VTKAKNACFRHHHQKALKNINDRNIEASAKEHHRGRGGHFSWVVFMAIFIGSKSS